MRITNINIKNYRQYQNLNLDFPHSKNNDLHIIVAQNGVGKTNLLNAITWCLYGKEPHLGDEDTKRGLPKLNLFAIEEAKNESKEKEYVEVSITAQDDDDTIIYRRRLPVRVEPIFEYTKDEEFSVTTAKSSGDPKVYEKTEAVHYVDKYMPEKIREYFYFDGEQLNDYFISKHGGQIREAIFSISQVDVVSRINERISVLIDAKRKEAGAKEPSIKKKTDALSACNEEIASITKKIIAIEEQIALSERVIQDNTEYLRGQENLPELEAGYQKLRDQQQELNKTSKKHIDEMYAFILEMKSVLAFYSAAQKALGIIAKKEADGAFPPNIDKTLLHQMLEDHICLICQQELSAHQEDIVKKLIDRFQISSETSIILTGIKNELERIINTAKTYPEKKLQIIEDYNRIENQIKEVERQLQEIDNQLSRFNDKEQIKHKHQERKEHEALRNANQQKLGISNHQLSAEQERKKELTSELTRELSKSAEYDRIRKLIDFAQRGQNIIVSVETEMMDEVRSKMELRTTEYFKQLVWKKNTYDRIELNDKFQLDLIHKDGYSCVGTCSAAERCLLALSFTLALHEVSGFNSLLFVDTPVARVSDNNRINFANVLCEVSTGKQIIMTFSPDEYSPEISRVFSPIASTNVEMHMIDEKVTVLN